MEYVPSQKSIATNVSYYATEEQARQTGGTTAPSKPVCAPARYGLIWHPGGLPK